MGIARYSRLVGQVRSFRADDSKRLNVRRCAEVRRLEREIDLRGICADRRYLADRQDYGKRNIASVRATATEIDHGVVKARCETGRFAVNITLPAALPDTPVLPVGGLTVSHDPAG